MAFRAVLDACVLYPASIRDTLLRLAERELYDVAWSAHILDEMERNLVRDLRAAPTLARRLRVAMEAAFPEASVPVDAIRTLEPAMRNDPKDRHVLAAAVAARADVIVTANVRDFPAEACAPLRVEAQTPDTFLCSLLDLDPPLVVDVIRQQAADLADPPLSPDELLDVLARAGASGFASAIRDQRRWRTSELDG